MNVHYGMKIHCQGGPAAGYFETSWQMRNYLTRLMTFGESQYVFSRWEGESVVVYRHADILPHRLNIIQGLVP